MTENKVISSFLTKDNDVNLIYGPRKGGTSLLQRLIDNDLVFSHPTETKLKFYNELTNKLIMNRNNNEFKYDEYSKFFRIKYKEELRIDENQYEQLIQFGIREVNSPKDYINLHLGASINASHHTLVKNKKKLFIKDVGGETEDIFNMFFNAFPNGKVISIIRNPKWTARAVLTDRKRRDKTLSLKQKIIEIIQPIKVNIAQKKFYYSSNMLTIDYDDLTDETSKSMKKIMKFFDTEYSKKNTYPTINGFRTVVATSSQNTDIVFSKKKSKLSDGISKADLLLIYTGPILYYGERVIKSLRALSVKLLVYFK